MQAGSRRTVYYAEIPGDSDILQIEANFQKTLAHVLADVFGSTAPAFTGLNVTAGTGFSINIGTGNVYQQIQAEATAWGSTAHGLPIDTEVITKIGSVPTALANQFSGSFAAPVSGNNYYTLEAKLLDADVNPTTLNFNPQPNVFPSQTLTTDRVTQVQFQIKGPSTSSPPAPDSGWFTIATFAIPSTATGMLGTYITMASSFPGFAGILAGGSFVQLSPGSPQSGFLNLSGNGTFGGSVVANSLSVSSTGVVTGLFTASGGINCNGTLSANAQAVVGTGGAGGVPLTVNGVAGGGQTAALIQGFLQSAGTLLFQVDAAGGVTFGGSASAAAKIYTTSLATRLVPANLRPFGLRNAGDSQDNFNSDNSGNVQIRTSLQIGLPTAVLTCDSSGNLTGNGRVSLVGSAVAVHGTTPNPGNTVTDFSVSITLPGPGTSSWDISVIWDFMKPQSSTSNISVTGGTTTDFFNDSRSTGAGNAIAAQSFAVASAPGNQTLTFDLHCSNGGPGSNSGSYTIRAVRVS